SGYTNRSLTYLSAYGTCAYQPCWPSGQRRGGGEGQITEVQGMEPYDPARDRPHIHGVYGADHPPCSEGHWRPFGLVRRGGLRCHGGTESGVAVGPTRGKRAEPSTGSTGAQTERGTESHSMSARRETPKPSLPCSSEILMATSN